MRKLCLFVLLICAALNVTGQEKPVKSGGAGIGLMYSSDFSGNIKANGAAISAFSVPVVFNNTGIFAYGDFVYTELICALFFGLDTEQYLKYLGADLGIYGKYPFSISPSISLFPLLGFDFQAALFGKFSGEHFENRHFIWRQFWFKTGAGLDLKIGEKMNLRFEALYGIRLKSGAGNATLSGIDVELNESVGHGMTIRIAIGI